METELRVMADEVALLRSRNVDLEAAVWSGADPVPGDVGRLRRQVGEQGRYILALDREVKELRIATCKLDVYKRCVEAEAQQLKALIK
jgi:hypothetical protein